jgi:hypothetical protein
MIWVQKIFTVVPTGQARAGKTGGLQLNATLTVKSSNLNPEAKATLLGQDQQTTFTLDSGV